MENKLMFNEKERAELAIERAIANGRKEERKKKEKKHILKCYLVIALIAMLLVIDDVATYGIGVKTLYSLVVPALWSFMIWLFDAM